MTERRPAEYPDVLPPSESLAVDASIAADADIADEAAKVRCEACPIRCFIKVGQTGSCDRYGNVDGVLTRMDPVTILRRTEERGGAIVPFAAIASPWNGELIRGAEVVGQGTGSGAR